MRTKFLAGNLEQRSYWLNFLIEVWVYFIVLKKPNYLAGLSGERGEALGWFCNCVFVQESAAGLYYCTAQKSQRKQSHHLKGTKKTFPVCLFDPLCSQQSDWPVGPSIHWSATWYNICICTFLYEDSTLCLDYIYRLVFWSFNQWQTLFCYIVSI